MASTTSASVVLTTYSTAHHVQHSLKRACGMHEASSFHQELQVSACSVPQVEVYQGAMKAAELIALEGAYSSASNSAALLAPWYTTTCGREHAFSCSPYP